MFGTYRTLLACVVLFQHLAAVPLIGQYAVHGFFVLSGFLMTKVMHESYGFTGQGKASFAINRALRLYPAYLVALIIAIIILLPIGTMPSTAFNRVMDIPANWAQWLQNISMVYWNIYPNQASPRISPATWALTIELFHYAAICLGISRNKVVTWIWLGLAAAFHLCSIFLSLGANYTYFHVLSGSLPFSIGALIYHYRGSLWAIALPAIPAAFMGLFAILMLALLARLDVAGGDGWLARICFYSNMALAGLFVHLLSNGVGNRKADLAIGTYSYHIYILHWPIGLLVFSRFFDLPWPERSIAGFGAACASLLVCAAISYLLTRHIDHPIENLRKQVRQKSAAGAPARIFTPS